MVVCLTGARFNMWADILVQDGSPDDNPLTEGEWVVTQHPDTGEAIRKWTPNTGIGSPDPQPGQLKSFRCVARGIIDGGIRVAGTTERFGSEYEGVDYVRIQFPPNTPINRRSRITNIRTSKNKILWVEEERGDLAPTIFNVVGVTPVVDPFGNHVESVALLERSEVQ